MHLIRQNEIFVSAMLKAAGYNWAAKLLNAILNFGMLVLLSQWLGAAERGVAAFYSVVIAIALVVNEWSSGAAAVYLVKRFDWKQLQILNYVWFIVASFSTVFFFLFWRKLDIEIAVLLSVASWLNAANTFHLHLFLGNHEMKLFAGFQVLPALLALIAAALFAAMGFFGARWFLIALIAAWSIAALSGWLVIRGRAWERMPGRHWKDLAKSAFGLAGQNQLAHLSGILNNRLIYIFIPAITLGVYANALALAEAMLLLPGSLGQVYYSRYAGVADDGQRSRLFSKGMKVNLLILGAGCIAIFLVPDSLYSTIFGEEFKGVKPMLQVLGLSCLAYSVYLLISYHFSSKGLFKINLLCILSGLIVQALGWLYFYLNDAISITAGLWLTAVSYTVIAFTAVLFMLYQKRIPN